MAEARTLAEIKLDTAYKFGCNRYLQGQGILEQSAQEIARKGKKPLVLTSPRAWEATQNRVAKSLDEAGMDYHLEIYPGHNSYEQAHALVQTMAQEGCDIVVGVGGGRIMDLAKSTAHFANTPVINIPTSVATCAAFAPLSVMYTPQGASLGSLRYDREVDGILVDLDVIVKAPARYMASGILDGMAKLIEIQNGHSQVNPYDFPIDLMTSFTLASFTTDLYKKFGSIACGDVARGELTKAVGDMVYLNVATTGMISGCSKGFGQSALAHETYELIRTHFTQEAKDFLHGEIVALALPLQLCYNGQEDQIPPLREMMAGMGLPLTLADIGIAPTPENLEILFQDLYHSPFVVLGPENEAKLRRAMDYLVH